MNLVRDILIIFFTWMLINSIFKTFFIVNLKKKFINYLYSNSKHQILNLKIIILCLSTYFYLKNNMLIYNYDSIFNQKNIINNTMITKLVISFIIFMLSKSIIFVTNSFNEYQKTIFKDKTNTILNNYIKVLILFIVIIDIILISSVWLEEKPMTIIAGISTVSVIFTILFKDLIWGIIASIVSANSHLVRIGDYITLEKLNISGSIIDISITTVKIKTNENKIVSFPTHMLINDVIKNDYSLVIEDKRVVELKFYTHINNLKEFVDKTDSFLKIQKDIINSYISIDDNLNNNICVIKINLETKYLNINQFESFKIFLYTNISKLNNNLLNIKHIIL